MELVNQDLKAQLHAKEEECLRLHQQISTVQAQARQMVEAEQRTNAQLQGEVQRYEQEKIAHMKVPPPPPSLHLSPPPLHGHPPVFWGALKKWCIWGNF